MDAAYANSWDNLLEMGVDLLGHGHSHTACDYKVVGTRVHTQVRERVGPLI